MNIVLKILVKLRPSIINSSLGKNLTKEDIMYALDKGYKITKDTPEHILRLCLEIEAPDTYKEIVYSQIDSEIRSDYNFIEMIPEEYIYPFVHIVMDMYEQHDVKQISDFRIPPVLFQFGELDFLFQFSSEKLKLDVEQFEYLMKRGHIFESYYDKFLFGSYDIDIQKLSEEDHKRACDAIKANIDKIDSILYIMKDEEVILYYLEKKGFKDFKEEHYRYINDYEKLYEIASKNRDTFDFSLVNEKLFSVWVKHDLSILTEKLPSSITSLKNYTDVVKEAIDSKKLGEDDLKQILSKGQVSTELYDYVLNKNIELVQYIIFLPEEIFMKYLDISPELLLKSLEKTQVSFSSSSEEKIKKMLIDYNIVLEKTPNSFIRYDVDIIYNMILQDPRIINNYSSFILSDSITPEMVENIARVIKEKKIIITDISFSNNYRFRAITKAFVENNPSLLETIDLNEIEYAGQINGQYLKQIGYKFSYFTKREIFYRLNAEEIIELLSERFELINSPNFVFTYNEKYQTKLYSLLLSKNYHLTEFSSTSLFKYDLLVIDALKNNTISLETVRTYREYLIEDGILYNYLMDNYQHETINSLFKLTQRVAEEPLKNTEHVILKMLRIDFSYCKKIDLNRIFVNRYVIDGFSDDFYKAVSDMFYKNYDENKEYIDTEFIRNNPYIVVREYLYNHNPYISPSKIFMLDRKLTKEILDNYQKEGVELDLSFIEKMAISDKEKLELIKENPSVLKTYHTNSQILSLIKNGIKEGTITINSDDISTKLAEDLFYFYLSNNLSGIDMIVRKLDSTDIQNNRDGIIRLLNENKITIQDISENIVAVVSRLSKEQIKKICEQNIINIVMMFNDIPTHDYLKAKYIPEEFDELLKLFQKNNLSLKTKALEEVRKNPVLALSPDFKYPFYKNELISTVHQAAIKQYREDRDNFRPFANSRYLIYKDIGELDEDIIEEIVEKEDTLNKCRLLVEVFDILKEDIRKDLIEEIRTLDIKEKQIVTRMFYSNKFIHREIYTDEELFEIRPSDLDDEKCFSIWVSKGMDLRKGISLFKVKSNPKYVIELLKKDIKNIDTDEFKYIKYIDVSLFKDYKEELLEIYEQNKDKISIYDSKLFYENDLILAKYDNEEEREKTFVFKDSNKKYFHNHSIDEQRKLLVYSVRNNPNSIDDILYYYYDEEDLIPEEVYSVLDEKGYVISNYTPDSNRVLEISLKHDFVKTIEMAGVDTIISRMGYSFEDIKSKLIESNYTITNDTSQRLKKDKDIIINSLINNPNSILFIDCSIEDEFTYEEKLKIQDAFIKNNFYVFDKFKFFSENYYISAIKYDPNNIDFIKGLKINNNMALKEFKKAALEGKYEFSVHSPTFIFFDDDIRKYVFEHNPELIKDIFELEPRTDEYEWAYDNHIDLPNNPISIVSGIVKGELDITELSKIDQNTIKEEKLEVLIQKLINEKYITNENTPKILFKNKEFVNYLLENDLYIDREIINETFSFEYFSLSKDRSILIKLLQKGFFDQYKDVYESDNSSMSIEEFADLILRYGDLLLLLDKESFKSGSINFTSLINQKITKDFAYIILKRENHQFTEEEIENGINGFYIRADDKIFRLILKQNPDFIKLYSGNNEDTFKFALSCGFVPTIENIIKYEILLSSESIMLEAAKEDINSVFMSKTATNIFGNVFELEDKNGKKIEPTFENVERLSLVRDDPVLMKIAIEYDPNNIINLDLLDDDLLEFAFSKGFEISQYALEKSRYLCLSKLLFKKILADEKINTEEYKKLLFFYVGEDEQIIKEIYKVIYADSYSKIINEENEQNYISMWQSFPSIDSHIWMTSLFKEEVVKSLEKSGIDYYILLKYGIKNTKMDNLIKIIKADSLDSFIDLYNKLKEYDLSTSQAFGVDFFLRTAGLFDKYPNLSEMLKEKLTPSQIDGLMKLIRSDVDIIYISDVTDLEKVNSMQTDAAKAALNYDDPRKIKDAILQYAFNIDLNTLKDYLSHLMTLDTVQKILNKIDDKKSNEYKEIKTLEITFNILEEMINATDDIDSLKQLLQGFIDNAELLEETRVLFYDLEEKIRRAYEIDANLSLTDLDKVDPSRVGKTSNGTKIIDLRKTNYVLYAHVTGYIEDYKGFVKYRFEGKVTQCVSPITALRNRVYGGGVVLGYTKVPYGCFIGSSVNNMGSSSFIADNNYEVPHHRFYGKVIEDSAALGTSHGETLLYRDGLVPSCIIIDTAEPDEAQKEAQQQISELLGYEIPFVRVQRFGNVNSLSEEEKEKQDERKRVKLETPEFVEQEHEEIDKSKLDKLQELEEKLKTIKVNKNHVYDIVSTNRELGGSHEIFMCKLSDREGTYLLKPGSKYGEIQMHRAYAMKTAYDIQKLVHPEGAVDVDTAYVPAEELNETGDPILCSVIKVINDSTSFVFDDTENLSDEEMESFMLEDIVDYLVFSYDTKPDNFVKDKNGIVYGIDKEQSLKFATSPSFKSMNEDGEIVFDTSFETHNSSDVQTYTVYKQIFEKVKQGMQVITKEMYDRAMQSIDVIDSIPDEEYIKKFEGYIDSVIKEDLHSNDEEKAKKRQEIRESILARKNKLKEEYIKYIYDIMTLCYSNRNEEVPEWVKNLNQTRSL